MMYGGWGGWGWMLFMPLFWIALVGLIVWMVVRLRPESRDWGHHGHPHGPPSPHGPPGPPERRESALEVLDRRFASGEIDEETYLRMRDHLRKGSSP